LKGKREKGLLDGKLRAECISVVFRKLSGFLVPIGASAGKDLSVWTTTMMLQENDC
jgi:hypothetical protein